MYIFKQFPKKLVNKIKQIYSLFLLNLSPVLIKFMFEWFGHSKKTKQQQQQLCIESLIVYLYYV